MWLASGGSQQQSEPGIIEAISLANPCSARIIVAWESFWKAVVPFPAIQWRQLHRRRSRKRALETSIGGFRCLEFLAVPCDCIDVLRRKYLQRRRRIGRISSQGDCRPRNGSRANEVRTLNQDCLISAKLTCSQMHWHKNLPLSFSGADGLLLSEGAQNR